MIRSSKNRVSNQAGLTILEILIASFITAILVLSGFQFYAHMHDTTSAQQELVDAQLICRNSVQELKKSFRMAGYKLGSHQPYDLSADTFVVYYQGANPIDTVRYFLNEFTESEYSLKPNLPSGVQLYRLFRQTNSDTPALFSDNIVSLQVRAIDAANLVIDITAITSRPDEEWNVTNGYRTYSLEEKVRLRNI